jgi:pimeloyl-ACP methyl ester carboxylesterase
VIGVSFGGWVALWLAARHPDLVEQLVLEAPSGLRDPGTGGLATDPAELRRQFYAVPERAPKQARSPEAFATNRRVRDDYGQGVSLDHEVCPVEPTGRRLKSGIPDSHLSYIYGAAHAVEFDQPERVARLVGAFLERGEAFVVRTAEVA